MGFIGLIALALAQPVPPYQDLNCNGIPNPIDWRTTPPTPLPVDYVGPTEVDNADDACVKWPETRRLRPDGTYRCSSDEILVLICGPVFDTAGMLGDTWRGPPGFGKSLRLMFDPANVDPDSDGFGSFSFPPECRPMQGQVPYMGCDPCPKDAAMPYPGGPVYDLDSDQDLIPDLCDGCPLDARPVTGVDSDHDGLDDLCDACPQDADPGAPDRDQDGQPDACDDCPDDAGTQGDADQDGLGDACDPCDHTLAGQAPGTDSDRDGFEDGCDVCPSVVNPDQADAEFDGVGDVCDDCPMAPDPFQPDRDGDGIGDACDVCPQAADPEQRDGDGDLIGDACEPGWGCGCASVTTSVGPWWLAALVWRRRRRA